MSQAGENKSVQTGSCIAITCTSEDMWNCRRICSDFLFAKFLKPEMDLFIVEIILVNVMEEFINNFITLV